MKIKKLSEENYLKKIVKEELLPDTEDYGEEYASDTYAEAVKEVLMSFYIPDNDLEEKFAEHSKLLAHFKGHCFGASRKSSRTNVYYDFDKINQYKNRIDYIDNLVPDISISDLHSKDIIKKALFELSKGNCNVFFTDTCGLKDENGDPFSLRIHTFANDVTQFYTKENTADYACYSKRGITKTCFPISFSKLKTKIDALNSV